MSDPLETNHLKLPYLAAAQAQKHVTHNEALRRLDSIVQLAVLDTSLTTPPGSPVEGDRYIVATGGTGDWDGKDGDVATFVDGAWEFAEPDDGWLAFDLSSETILVWLSGAWAPASAAPSLVDFLGINATADTTNRLAVRSAAVLFSGIEAADGGGSGDIRFTVNKETAADTASLLFQRDWSGRAEVGLVGDDDFVFKVSPDGAAWTEAIRIDKDTGLAAILYDNGASGLAATNVQDAIDEIVATDVANVFGRTGAVVATTSDYDASQVDNDSGVSGSTVKDALNTLNSGKAALASPALTGTPVAPTAAVDTNTTQLATTAFVLGQASASGDGTPAANGTAARGSSAHFARADHVHPTDTSRAALVSPTFTGTPAAPTASAGTNTTQLATTAFVSTAVSGKLTASSNLSDVANAATARGNLSAAASGANGDITSMTAMASLNAGPLGGIRNRWTNGEFEIWQRGTASTSCPAATRTILADRIYVNPAGAAVTQQRSTTVPTGAFSRYSLLVTGATSVTTCLVGQRFEAAAIPFVKRTITFQAKVFNGSGGSITPNLLIGTPAAADNFATVTNRLIQALQSCADAAWTTVSFSVDISGYTNVDNGIQVELQIPSGALSSGAKSVKIAEIDVSPGNAVGTFEACPVDILLPRCQRYFEKSYLMAVAPGTNAPTAYITLPVVSNTIANNTYLGVVQYRVTKRAQPTVTIYGYQGGAGKISDFGGNDLAASSGIATNPSGDAFFNLYQSSGGAATTSSLIVICNWTAEAEL